MTRFRTETIGDAVVYLGDCREVLPTLQGVAAVVTDPPYGIARVWQGGGRHGWGNAKAQTDERNSWDDEGPDAETMARLIEAERVIIWGGNYFDLPPSRGWLVWNKPERGFTLAEAELAWTNIDTVIRVFDGNRSDVGRVHPTQKPVALMQWCVSKTEGRVCDPFMGSGTTGVACINLSRPFVGVEIHEPYFDIACRRLEEAWKQPRLFAEPAPKAKQGALDL